MMKEVREREIVGKLPGVSGSVCERVCQREKVVEVCVRELYLERVRE